ncbi:LuxR C-terminal-related transcriptional regulator [Yokenella regensburgei]|uniref:LuxR C-terminal-related transcriptional regulator n=1 Tax=Yokenella regensburgei TaxID=158877 RepID=UPI00143280E9|nr:LuxR C-terminal-related transcriptional regulator [Yokenella regensburgei]QIU89161.1 hypothetical protein HEC60_07260 [Yokenella regensburgei]
MQIYSCDNYFILGVRSLIETLNINDVSGMIVFDTGSECVYIFHGDKLRHADINDPFSALVYCRGSLLGKNATLKAYTCRLQASIEKNLDDERMAVLTRREEMIIKALYKVSNRKRLAKMFSISEKTVSAHTIRGLNKIGVKNTNALHRILQAWQTVLPAILPDSQL